MSEPIIVGTDGSESAKRAVIEAVRLKALGAEVHVVSAYEPLRVAPIAGSRENLTPLPDAIVDSTLAQAAALIRGAGVTVRDHAVRGDPADALLKVAAEVNASLIVVGSQGMHGAQTRSWGCAEYRVSQEPMQRLDRGDR